MTLLISPFPTDCKAAKLADIVFIIDESGSIGTPNFQLVRAFLHSIVSGLDVGPKRVRVGIMSFADRPSFDLTAHSDTKALEDAVLKIQQKGGGTETGRALNFMGPYFERAEASRGHKVSEYLIVITDGKSSDEVKIPAEKLRAQGVKVYAIGVKNADQEELREISGDPARMFFVNNFDALKPIKDNIVTDICSPGGKKTALKFKMCVSLSAGDSEAGVIEMIDEAVKATSSTKQRSLTTNPSDQSVSSQIFCLSCKDQPGDLIFLIDSSGSIEYDDYQKMKDFMKSVIGKSIIGQNDVHVGVMQFSDRQTMEFPLNSFYSQDEMLQAIGDMIQFGGGTLTGEAITAVSQYFDVARGGRPNLKQRLVVITDGEAQDEVEGPAASLRANGVLVYAIGVVNANTTQLLEISGTPDRMYSERDFDALKDLESEVALELCEPDRGESGLRL
uniref:VWFA domain-containing protein n=1 Tax=Labrus bergylta TaxID=56723 RepID=A0A3Q3FK60_9LABR